jgi:dienelactone hydrolase
MLLLFVIGDALAENPSVPVSAYARLPQLSGFDVSPSGNRVLMFQPAGDSLHLVVLDLVAKTTKLALASDPEQFYFNACRFHSDDRIVCSVRAYIKLQSAQLGFYREGRIIVTRLFGVDADGSHFTRLVPDAVNNVGASDLVWNAQLQDRIVSWLPDDPDHILIQLNRMNRNYPDVYKADVRQSKIELVAKNVAPVSFWYATAAGKVVLGTGIRDTSPVAFVREGHGFGERTIAGVAADAPLPDIVDIADEQTAYVSADIGEGRTALHGVDLGNLQIKNTLCADPEFDIFGGLIHDPQTRRPVGVVYERDHATLKWFEPSWQARADEIDRALPGMTNVPVGSNRAGDVMVIASVSPTTVPTFYLYRANDRKLVRFGVSYPELPADSIAPLRPVRYPARDGLSIPAFLAVPNHGETKRLPTIVFPHGGPYVRDTDEFDYWTQFFVSRGYVVLKPNFRGSMGYGTAFLRAGFEQWGEKMQDDVIDGLDWMIAQGITDPTRVCIVGGSYGGYVALVAAYKTPERFRCAVDFAGVADLDAMVRNLHNYQFGQLTRVRIQHGDALDANSPVEHVAEFGIPLLIVHGDEDRVVYYEQSENLAAALTRAAKPFQYIRQPGGDHYLSRASQRLQLFEAMDAFLNEHLAAAPSASGTPESASAAGSHAASTTPSAQPSM